jgi:hypothetical protein
MYANECANRAESSGPQHPVRCRARVHNRLLWRTQKPKKTANAIRPRGENTLATPLTHSQSTLLLVRTSCSCVLNGGEREVSQPPTPQSLPMVATGMRAALRIVEVSMV